MTYDMHTYINSFCVFETGKIENPEDCWPTGRYTRYEERAIIMYVSSVFKMDHIEH